MEAHPLKIEKLGDFIEGNNIIQQLQFLEQNLLIKKWPDHLNIEYTLQSLFDRLKIVRDTNKKHI